MGYAQYIERPFTKIELYARALARQFEETARAAGLGDEFWNDCANILELGAGQGIVVLALSYLTPTDCKIKTVDIEIPIHSEVVKKMGERLESHLDQTIVDFLASYAYAKFDLLTLINVGNYHGITDANLLAKVLKPKGVVLDCMTNLPQRIMTPTFRLIEANRSKVWVLKEDN